MKAAQINNYGHADAVSINEVEKPIVTDGKVLVEVYASSINPFDTMVREGYLKEAIPLQLPVTLGGDISGVVSEVGTDVTNVSVGDKVYGQANVVAGNSGALAEFALTSAEQIAKMPSNLDFNDSASLVLVGVSALQAVKDHLNIQPGQKVLIHGGSGGIGSVAIQIAKNSGAYVATTATGEGTEYVKKLGADKVIDYMEQKFEEILTDYDAVFDTVGGETYEKSFRVLKRDGIIVSMIAEVNEELATQYGVTSLYQSTKVNTEALDKLSDLIESGAITPHVDKIFPLDEIQQAFEARESGKIVGKVVVSIK